MTRKDIIRIAREIGVPFWPTDVHVTIYELQRFAALVAAHEREACAQACEARNMGDNNREDAEAKRCAAAIRARGEQEQPR